MPLGEVQLQPAPGRKARATCATRVAVVRRVVRLESGERGERVRAAVHAAAEGVDSARMGAEGGDRKWQTPSSEEKTCAKTNREANHDCQRT